MLFIRGARQLVTLRGPWPRHGPQHLDLGVIRDGSLLIDGDRIEEVGSTRRIENLAKARGAHVIDAAGKVVTPGLVDSCTRLIFSAPPLRLFEERSAGVERRFDQAVAASWRPPSLKSYSPRMLRERAQRWTSACSHLGTTTVEIRCGDPLSGELPIRALQAVRDLDGHPIETRGCWSTGNHAFLPEPRPADALRSALDEVARLADRRLRAYACEIECGAGGLPVEAARRVAAAARAQGLAVKISAGRWAPGDGVELAVEAGALTAEHLRRVTETDIDRLAASSVIATLLPAVALEEGDGRLPPARRIIDRGGAVALASGFGGTGPSLSLPLAMSLACRRMRMMPEEALVAATINGAAALGRADRIGSLEPGKQADVCIFDVSDFREIPYHLAMNLCAMTIKRGRVIHWIAGRGGRERRR